MDGENEIVIVEMTNEQRKRQIDKTRKAIHCGMFTSLEESENIDDKIFDMKDTDFKRMTTQFGTVKEFIKAVFQIRGILIKNDEIPETLLQRVKQVRVDYANFIMSKK